MATMAMAMAMALTTLNPFWISPSSSSSCRTSFKPARCSSIQQVQVQVDSAIACDPCNGKGWIVCDFCKGQKTNVKAENNRIYRRCPSCRAANTSFSLLFLFFPCSLCVPHPAAIIACKPGVGYVLCSKCKVFKCVTFPNYSDGADLSL